MSADDRIAGTREETGGFPWRAIAVGAVVLATVAAFAVAGWWIGGLLLAAATPAPAAVTYFAASAAYPTLAVSSASPVIAGLGSAVAETSVWSWLAPLAGAIAGGVLSIPFVSPVMSFFGLNNRRDAEGVQREADTQQAMMEAYARQREQQLQRARTVEAMGPNPDAASGHVERTGRAQAPAADKVAQLEQARTAASAAARASQA